MITIVLGGQRSDETVARLCVELCKPPFVEVLGNDTEWAIDFARRISRAAQMVDVSNRLEEGRRMKKADDDLLLFLSDQAVAEFLQRGELLPMVSMPIMLANCLELTKQLYINSTSQISEVGDLLMTHWPSGWPEVRLLR